jgi:Peptidase family M28
MEAARPPRRRRQPRRGTVESPVNTRLVRVTAIVVAPALLALLFSISTTGHLPPPQLAPLFDRTAAATIASQLTSVYPARIPGSLEDPEAARWYEETISGLGFTTDQDVWTQDLPDLGHVELRNLVTVVPGRSPDAIVVVAHRDNAGIGKPYGDNASGTATLIEIARGFASQETAPSPRPQHTLVLVSTDAGAYGGAGAKRFVSVSPYARDAIAAIVLDGLGNSGRPRIALAGNEPRSPAPALVSTATARVREQTGLTPSLPSVVTQLVDFGLPYAAGEQGSFLAGGVASVTLTTQGATSARVPVGDSNGRVSAKRLGELGRATESLVGSLDASAGSQFRTPDRLFFRDRVASGWAMRLTLIVAIVPFALAALDLLVRTNRRRIRLAPAARALRARLLFWLYIGLLFWLGAVSGVFPTGPSLVPSPFADEVDAPIAGLILLAVALGLGWVIGKRRLVPASPAAAEERLAGYAVALAWLALVAVLVAIAHPYGLVFVLPSLYAWLWIPLRETLWARAALFAVGLAGPILGLVVVAAQLGTSLPRAAYYVLGLASVGYVPRFSVLLALAWGAATAQVGALAVGRYASYAEGREPPPPGAVRKSIGRLGRRLRRA